MHVHVPSGCPWTNELQLILSKQLPWHLPSSQSSRWSMTPLLGQGAGPFSAPARVSLLIPCLFHLLAASQVECRSTCRRHLAYIGDIARRGLGVWRGDLFPSESSVCMFYFFSCVRVFLNGGAAHCGERCPRGRAGRTLSEQVQLGK